MAIYQEIVQIDRINRGLYTLSSMNFIKITLDTLLITISERGIASDRHVLKLESRRLTYVALT